MSCPGPGQNSPKSFITAFPALSPKTCQFSSWLASSSTTLQIPESCESEGRAGYLDQQSISDPLPAPNLLIRVCVKQIRRLRRITIGLNTFPGDEKLKYNSKEYRPVQEVTVVREKSEGGKQFSLVMFVVTDHPEICYRRLYEPNGLISNHENVVRKFSKQY